MLLGSAFLRAEGRVERVANVVNLQVARATALRLPSSASAAQQLAIPWSEGPGPG